MFGRYGTVYLANTVHYIAPPNWHSAVVLTQNSVLKTHTHTPQSCHNLFYDPLKNFSLIWRHHHYQWRATKFRAMLGAQGIWAGRDLYRATSAVTRGLSFSGLIRSTAQFSRFLRLARGCRGRILTRILITGPHSLASYDTQGDAEDPFLPGSSRLSL
jgi:hypothetical protein